MVSFLRAGGSIRGFGVGASLLFLLAMGLVASCHPPHSTAARSHRAGVASTEDSLGKLFPLPEHLVAQHNLLHKVSKPAKRPRVSDKFFEGNFGSGAIELILEEIDGEPNRFFGHLGEGNGDLEGDGPSVQMAFIVYGISNAQLDLLVPGQTYRVHWLETVVDMKALGDERYRDFVAYRIEGI